MSSRPLGSASGVYRGFWNDLGVDGGGLPVHLPIAVNEAGEGPQNHSDAHTYICWCADPDCPLTRALGNAWAAGTRTP